MKDEGSAAEWQLHAADAEARYITDREGYAVRVLGGLCVIGTERHEARRIDNQLRGRAGRQGDPGESRFYLSLEDNLLRLFGKERIHKVSEMMVQRGIPDDSPLEDPLVSKVITAAQQQVESMHFADMEGLKAGIGLRAYGHRDPLVEYKEEAYRAFSRLVDSIYEDSLRAVLRLPVESAGAASSGLSEEDNPFRPEGMVYSDSRSAPEASPLEAPDPAGGNPLG